MGRMTSALQVWPKGSWPVSRGSRQMDRPPNAAPEDSGKPAATLWRLLGHCRGLVEHRILASISQNREVELPSLYYDATSWRGAEVCVRMSHNFNTLPKGSVRCIGCKPSRLYQDMSSARSAEPVRASAASYMWKQGKKQTKIIFYQSTPFWRSTTLSFCTLWTIGFPLLLYVHLGTLFVTLWNTYSNHQIWQGWCNLEGSSGYNARRG
jgi:hypothetical protein